VESPAVRGDRWRPTVALANRLPAWAIGLKHFWTVLLIGLIVAIVGGIIAVTGDLISDHSDEAASVGGLFHFKPNVQFRCWRTCHEEQSARLTPR